MTANPACSGDSVLNLIWWLENFNQYSPMPAHSTTDERSSLEMEQQTLIRLWIKTATRMWISGSLSSRKTSLKSGQADTRVWKQMGWGFQIKWRAFCSKTRALTEGPMSLHRQPTWQRGHHNSASSHQPQIPKYTLQGLLFWRYQGFPQICRLQLLKRNVTFLQIKFQLFPKCSDRSLARHCIPSFFFLP